MKDLILLHGALGSQTQFDLLKSKLEPEYNCHTLDFYGHGTTPFGAEFGIEAFAQQVKEYIDTNKLEHPSVFGYSMGGYAALFLEANNNHLFSKIMTLGTKFAWTREFADKEADSLNPGILLEKSPQYAGYLELLHGEKWRLLCEKTAEMMRYLGSMMLINADTLESVDIPVRISVGDKDRMVTLEETVQAFRYLKQGSFLVMPSTPHPLEKVNADRLAYKIRKFLES